VDPPCRRSGRSGIRAWLPWPSAPSGG
jgi:hypothetical protein